MASELETRLGAKAEQWNREAMFFIAQHAKNGGTFWTRLWANGQWMVEVPNGRANQAITVEQFTELKNNGFQIIAEATDEIDRAEWVEVAGGGYAHVEPIPKSQAVHVELVCGHPARVHEASSTFDFPQEGAYCHLCADARAVKIYRQPTNNCLTLLVE